MLELADVSFVIYLVASKVPDGMPPAPVEGHQLRWRGRRRSSGLTPSGPNHIWAKDGCRSIYPLNWCVLRDRVWTYNNYPPGIGLQRCSFMICHGRIVFVLQVLQTTANVQCLLCFPLVPVDVGRLYMLAGINVTPVRPRVTLILSVEIMLCALLPPSLLCSRARRQT